MSMHVEREIKRLKKKLQNLSDLVESNVGTAIRALLTADTDLAQQALAADIEADEIEVEVEEDCLKMMALYQPTAIDLRVVVGILKINTDLERIGDLARTIAYQARDLASCDRAVQEQFPVQAMDEKVRGMLHNSLQAFVNLDGALAKAVLAADSEVDAFKKQCYRISLQFLNEHKGPAEPIIYLLSVARSLERIADHATNIAEDVIYMMEGVIVRHGRTVKRPS